MDNNLFERLVEAGRHGIEMNTVYDGYKEAALWTSEDEIEVAYGDKADIAEETEAEMREDVEAFVDANLKPLVQSELASGLIGHNFWLTRNGHGTGFWDRDLGAIGDELTDACKAFPEYSLYAGDDGKIYGSGG